ncbi:MAG: chromosomal replication initiator protein DnaA [Clostridia bacterium]
MLTPSSIWEKSLKTLETVVTSYSFDVWIKNLKPVNIVENKLIISAPTKSAYGVILDNYLDKIVESVQMQNLFVTDVELVMADALSDTQYPAPTEIEKEEMQPEKGISLISKYTFDSFVVGDSNKFVHAAARAVAENPGTRYNPLFIYGGVGLGKTHIMHAIGNYLKENNPTKKLIYTTSERFTNEFIDSLRSASRSSTQKFKEYYRSADVLMIDDVQFFENKPSVQEELFHTFNELHNENRQIILTSDRMPKDIPSLEERLRTRFEWGIIADVQPPSIETKVAILRMKAEYERYVVPNDVIYLIAERVESNIREMESLLSRVALYAKMLNQDITMSLANESLKDYIDHRKAQMSADTVIDATCKYFNVTRSDITSKKKTKEIVEPRQIAIYLILEFLSLPLASIGQIFGGRDHTTIIHARDKISDRLKTDKKLVVQLNDIRNMIRGN